MIISEIDHSIGGDGEAFSLPFSHFPTALPTITSSLPRAINSLTMKPSHTYHSLQKKFVLHCYIPTPLQPSIENRSPNIILKLHDLPKKSTNSAIYRFHFSEKINSFPNAVLCYTEGSKFNHRIGGTFSIGNEEIYFLHRNSASILTAELQAIFLCLENILLRSSRIQATFYYAPIPCPPYKPSQTPHQVTPSSAESGSFHTTLITIKPKVTFI